MWTEETVNAQNKDLLETMKMMARDGTLRGCFADIPVDVYHHPECPGVSSTQLKGILKQSYKHYELERGKSTAALRFGSAFHCFVNEPEEFVNSYQIIHKKSSEFLAPGKLALMDSDFLTIQNMAKKLYVHPDAGPLLSGAQNELSYFSVDSETGILKKCRVDAIKDDVISDLKSCEDASPDGFRRASQKWLTRVSAAYYLEIVSETLMRHLNIFNLIACEKDDPYEIAVYKVSEESLIRGSAEVRKALSIIKTIKEQGVSAWKGYELGIKDISI